MSTNLFDAVIKIIEDRVQQNEAKLSQLQEELAEWRRRAHAHCPACGTRSIRSPQRKEKPFAELSLTEAVMMCLLEYDYPISARTLRLKLDEKGYPKPKLGRYGNYLHTVICRLIDAGKVRRVEGDEIVAI